jgi:hypothetical protein
MTLYRVSLYRVFVTRNGNITAYEVSIPRDICDSYRAQGNYTTD